MNPEKSLASVGALTDAQRQVHSGWVNSWQNVIIGLDGYVRDFHPRGLKWKKSSWMYYCPPRLDCNFWDIWKIETNNRDKM